MNIPADLKYTEEHEWIRVEGNIVTVGITDYAQGELGDVVFVELPESGVSVERGGVFGSIEAVKAVSDLYAPLSGRVTEVNEALEDDPTIVNTDAFGDGWMIKIELSDPSELDNLIDAAGYTDLVSNL